MHDRCSQETRNTQAPHHNHAPTKGRKRGRAMVLLPQDPTVCQTLPGGSFRRAFQDAFPEGDPSVLAAGLCRQAPIC